MKECKTCGGSCISETAYIDKQFKVIRCEECDFQFEAPIEEESNKNMDKVWVSNLRVFNSGEGYDINFYDYIDKQWKQIHCSKDEIELDLLSVLKFIEKNKERCTEFKPNVPVWNVEGRFSFDI